MNTTNPFQQLEVGMFAALETYSNVHRGSGHFSKATTHLYGEARYIVLNYMGLKNTKYTLLFLTPRRFAALSKVLKPGSFAGLHSRDFGLNLGVSAMAVRKKTLPAGIPIETGGGTTRLYGTDWVMWAKTPDRFEAGTPAIINIIGFAKALLLIKTHGKDAFIQAYQQPAHIRQEIIEEVKRICADTMGAPLADYEVVFSSNTTESINIAAQSLAGHVRHSGIEAARGCARRYADVY